MRAWSRTMMVYSGLWLALILFTRLCFAGLTGVFYAEATQTVPNFTARVEQLQKEQADDPEDLEQGLFDLMKPVIMGEDFVSIRILLCMILFAPVGFLAGFLSGDPRWVGGFSVLGLVPPDPTNPAVMEYPFVPLAGVEEQIMLFGLQLAILYACAWSGAVRYWRRRRPALTLEDDDQEKLR